MDQNNQQNPVPVAPPDPQVAPTEGQKVQYVIVQNSLNGLGGWLLFFLVMFALTSIGYVGFFFQTLTNGIKTASDGITTLFAPFLAVGFLIVVVLLAMRKKLAVKVIYASLATAAAYSVITQIVSPSQEGVAMMISGIVVSIIMFGLMALYFRQSRRVKETLVK